MVLFFRVLFFQLQLLLFVVFFFFQAEDGIRDLYVTGVQTCALPISPTYWTRSPPYSSIRDTYVWSRRSRKRLTNSSRSAGVRCCQWGPRLRRAVSETSNTWRATSRTWTRRSAGV